MPSPVVGILVDLSIPKKPLPALPPQSPRRLSAVSPTEDTQLKLVDDSPQGKAFSPSGNSVGEPGKAGGGLHDEDLLERETFDFNCISPKSLDGSNCSAVNDDAVANIEKQAAAAVGSPAGGTSNKSSTMPLGKKPPSGRPVKPLSPLKPKQMVELFKEANALACHISINYGSAKKDSRLLRSSLGYARTGGLLGSPVTGSYSCVSPSASPSCFPSKTGSQASRTPREPLAPIRENGPAHTLPEVRGCHPESKASAKLVSQDRRRSGRLAAVASLQSSRPVTASSSTSSGHSSSSGGVQRATLGRRSLAANSGSTAGQAAAAVEGLRVATMSGARSLQPGTRGGLSHTPVTSKGGTPAPCTKPSLCPTAVAAAAAAASRSRRSLAQDGTSAKMVCQPAASQVQVTAARCRSTVPSGAAHDGVGRCSPSVQPRAHYELRPKATAAAAGTAEKVRSGRMLPPGAASAAAVGAAHKPYLLTSSVASARQAASRGGRWSSAAGVGSSSGGSAAGHHGLPPSSGPLKAVQLPVATSTSAGSGLPSAVRESDGSITVCNVSAARHRSSAAGVDVCTKKQLDAGAASATATTASCRTSSSQVSAVAAATAAMESSEKPAMTPKVSNPRRSLLPTRCMPSASRSAKAQSSSTSSRVNHWSSTDLGASPVL